MSSAFQQRVKPLAVQVYEQLRTAIIREELAPGTRLIELDLAAQLGTSQGPVREALQRLEREGLVRRHAHISTFVSEISDEEMQELFCIRSVIERFAVKRAMPYMTPERMGELEALVERMREAGVRNDMLAFTEQDLLFHRLICQWSRSYSLLRAWDPLYSQIQRFVIHTHNRYFKGIREIADTHLPVIEAFRSGDVSRAQREIHEHVMLIWSMMEMSRVDDGNPLETPPQPTACDESDPPA
ncbi:MAG: GntR family transcriptional regulator [Caldilineaceae bacterium]